MNMLIDKYQRRRLDAAGGVKITDSTVDIDDLKRKVAALNIACQAMFELLQTHLDISDADIIHKMEEIDGRDGDLDGKTAPTVILCPQCGRTSNDSRSTCVYCGASLTAFT